MEDRFSASIGMDKPITKETLNPLCFKIKDYRNMGIKFKKKRSSKMRNRKKRALKMNEVSIYTLM